MTFILRKCCLAEKVGMRVRHSSTSFRRSSLEKEDNLIEKNILRDGALQSIRRKCDRNDADFNQLIILNFI
jgi:hypothetical protein